MSEYSFYQALLYSYIGLAAITALYLLKITAPYGRHARSGFGPKLNATVGWVLMEAPASLAPLLLLLIGGRHNPVLFCFAVIWQTHYINRAFIFPFRRRGGAPMPLLVPILAIVFNLGNAYLNWRYLTVFSPIYSIAWLTDHRFIIGVIMFAIGMFINQQSDRILFNLRKPGETGYKIPMGGMYRYISCPNYFGELLEWVGWAVLTWSLPGAVFALWTAANLVPRALSHHRDYRRRFDNYPADRKAIIPMLL